MILKNQKFWEKAERDEAAAKYYGIEIGKRETAIEMLKNNINRQLIIKCTGLSEKELDKIAEAM